MLQYVYLLSFYADLLDIETLWNESRVENAKEIYATTLNGIEKVRLVCVWFLAADFAKYALGFFQLASMAELAIVIKFSAIQIKLISTTNSTLKESQMECFDESHANSRHSVQIITETNSEQNDSQDSLLDRSQNDYQFNLEAAV